MDRQDYQQEIEELAKQVTAEASDYDRDINEVLHETLDGHQFVIYTGQAQQVLLLSPNDGAIEDYGIDSAIKDGALNWSALAYCAMEADVREHEAFNEEND